MRCRTDRAQGSVKYPQFPAREYGGQRVCRSALVGMLSLVALFSLACSDAHLYGIGMEDPSADRLGLSGQVCTDDPREAGFPVRVVFLVDVAAGPMFSSFDTDQVRLQALRDAVSLYEGNEDFSFAVVGFGPASYVFAPATGYFTRNPGELDNGIAMLGLSRGCADENCRDYEGGLAGVRALIEGDLAGKTAGERSRTQYEIVLMGGGPPSPLECDNRCCDDSDETCSSVCTESWSCTQSLLRDDVLELREAIEARGALALSLHALFLAAPDTSEEDPEDTLERTESLLQEMAFAGAGRFERFDSAEAITLERIGLQQLSSVLEAKSLLVTNLSLLPGSETSGTDSDGDGLADVAELAAGTSPFSADSDEDGLGDLLETLISFDPLVENAPPPACSSLIEGPPYSDTDGDRLNDCEEKVLGTDGSLPDTDGDGLPDGLELTIGTDYLRADTLEDSDWDGAVNGDEALHHTDPRSSDVSSQLGAGYRYEVTDEGLVRTPLVHAPSQIEGVTILAAGSDTAAGLGVLTYSPGTPPRLSWQDAQDEAPGPPQEVLEAGQLRLDSSSVTSAGLERWILVDALPARFPPNGVQELLLVEVSERQCLSYTVRNIRLVETASASGEGGQNDIFIYFAESPAGRLTLPGLFRVAHVPVRFHPETGREPDAPIVEVNDGEFVTIGL